MMRVPTKQKSPASVRRAHFSAGLALILGGLLALPGIAVLRMSHEIDLRWICGYCILISVATWVLYAREKRLAEAEQWRIPENALHLAELLGGWPAAFVAQRIHRHKIRKLPYQALFWLIIAIHQYFALDFLRDWKISKRLLAFIKP